MTRLSTVMRDALEKMSEQLSNEAMASVKREEQQALLEAASLVSQHRTEIENRFRRSFGDIFERRLFATKSDAADSSEMSMDQLALVSEDVINDSIEVGKLVHKAKGKLDPTEVLGIRARLGALLDRDWFDEESHPAAPEAIFEALKACLGQFEARPETAAALLHALEPHISSNLNAIYSKVNERLVARKVLPVIRQVIKPGHSPRRAAPAGVGADGMVDQGYGAVAPPDARTMAAAQMLASLDDPNAALAAMLASLAQGGAHARANATRLIADPEAFGLIDLPATDSAGVIGHLSSLQDYAVDLAIPPSALSANLAAQVSEKTGPLDNLMVEVVSMVFDYIYRDDRLKDTVKQQLLRLQVVAIKAALIDKSFFARRQHPMRQFLERVVDMCVDPETDTSENSLVATELTSMVDSIVQGFDQDLSIFDVLLVRLDELFEKEQARREDWLAKQTQEAAKREEDSALQDNERSKLLQRIDDRSPAFVREFLLRWWPAVMVKLSKSTSDEAIEQGMRIAEGLIWSVAPKTAEEIPRLASLLPKLINGLMKGLRLIEITSDERESFFNELLRTHTRAIEAAKAVKPIAPGTTTITPNNLNAVRPAVTIDANGVLQFQPRPISKHDEPMYAATVTLGQATVDSYKRGVLFNIARPDGTLVRLKLSWVSPARKFYLFSRFPDIALQLDRAEFMAMLDDGRAVEARGADLVDDVVNDVAQDTRAA
jgi:Protein of unknown function (DUF1631)